MNNQLITTSQDLKVL